MAEGILTLADAEVGTLEELMGEDYIYYLMTSNGSYMQALNDRY